MSFIDMFRVGAIKEELAKVREERDSLKKKMIETGQYELYEVNKALVELQGLKSGLVSDLQTIESEIKKKKNEVVVLDDEILLQSFGFYRLKYDFESSELYKRKLDEIQDKQERMIKAGEGAFCKQEWTINNNKKEGERMTRDYLKLILRSFNNECDASISRVKFSNIDSIEKKITKAFETLNKLGARMHMQISKNYLDLKLEELRLCYEYQLKKQQEKEEQKRIREQMREEARLLKEIEEARQSLEKEEKHFKKAISEFERRLSIAKTDAERQVLIDEKDAIQKSLDELQAKKKEVDYREQNTRAGYVYIISNLGSFGENVYKIGVTRRLDPVERVDELGDASVPFDFDIHALVFSEDAPALENALHKAFSGRRLNMVNLRKEFFKVSLEEIAEVVRKNFNKPVEITLAAEAAEFRRTRLIINNDVESSALRVA